MTETTIMLMHMSSPCCRPRLNGDLLKSSQREKKKKKKKRKKCFTLLCKTGDELIFLELICNTHLISIGKTKFVYMLF